MTIEFQETRFGRPVGEPQVVVPGSSDWLNILPVYGTFVGRSLRVDNKDQLTVTLIASGVPMPKVLKEQEINNEKIKTSPLVKFSDLFLWRRRHYSWKKDNS